MSTFETLLHSAMDLTEMRQLGNVKTRRVQVIPESGSTYTITGTEQNQVFFSLPSGSKYTMINGMNSYMCFDIELNATGGTTPQIGICGGDANAVFNSLEVTNGGQTIEQIEKYNLLSSVFNDFVSLEKSKNLNSILSSGCSAVKLGNTGVGGTFYRVAVPIYSAFYGSLAASNYAPATDGIRMRFQLEGANTALFSPTAGVTALSYTISNMNLMMEYVDVEPAVWEQLANNAGREFKTHGIGVASYSSTLAASLTSSNILVPCRKSAVKHIWTIARVSSNLNNITKNTLGDRVLGKVRQFYYTISGKQFPQIPIRTSNSAGTAYSGGEAMAELLKTFRNLHSPLADCVFDGANYIDIVGTNGTGSFVAAFDWETDADPKTISGIDTNSSNIYLQLDAVSAGFPAALTIDNFVFYDAILTTSVDDGRVSIIQ